MGYDWINRKTYAWYRDGTVSARSSMSHDFSSAMAPVPYRLPAGKTPDDIVGMACYRDVHCYAWYRDGTVSAGEYCNLESYRAPYAYHLPQTLSRGGTCPIVGMAIAQDTGYVYAWYRDGTVSAGTSEDLIRHRRPYSYVLATGKTPDDVVEFVQYAGRNNNTCCLAYYMDGTFSAGDSDNLARHVQSSRYLLPEGKMPGDIVGMGARYRGRRIEVITWYRDGTVSVGEPGNLGSARAPAPYALPHGKRPGNIIGVGIARNGDCFAWYHDGTVSSGRFDNLGSRRAPYPFRY
jgi:hypothetical protein